MRMSDEYTFIHEIIEILCRMQDIISGLCEKSDFAISEKPSTSIEVASSLRFLLIS